MKTRFGNFLILIAFLAGVIAPACGFSWNGQGNNNYSLVEVCTTEGIEMKVVENDTAPSTPHEQASEDCQFCFQNHHVMANILPTQTHSAQIYSLTAKILNTHDILYRQILSQYHTARAPPSYI